MASTKFLWYILVDKDKNLIGNVSHVAAVNAIWELKDSIKAIESPFLQDVQSSRIRVWRCPDYTFDDDDSQLLSRKIKEAFSTNQVKHLSEMRTIAELKLIESEVLLVEVPVRAGELPGMDSFGEPMASKVGREYEQLVLRVRNKGKFMESDITLNELVLDAVQIPGFVEELEKTLGGKRKAAENMRVVAEAFDGEGDYFDYSTTPSSGSTPVADQLEVAHVAHISSVDGMMSWEMLRRGHRRPFKEAQANWLFFFTIAHHIELLPPKFSRSGDDVTIAVKRGQESWPFSLVIQVEEDQHEYKYRPKSDFLILQFGLPRVAVEVNSNSPDRPAVDHHRLMLQGASIVRFANTFLDVYREEKNFIFVAIFISDTGIADRYFLYQTEAPSRTVHFKTHSFNLKSKVDRLKFTLELYNLASVLYNESENEDTIKKVKNLVNTFDQLSKKLPAFTSKTKRPASSDGSQPGPSVRRKGNDAPTEQLEAHGYEIEPDVFEAEGGTWELLPKLPSHIRIVYRRNDPQKIKRIAKHVRDRSNELNFLKCFHSRSLHVISLIDIVPATPTTGEWLILPQLRSICDQGLMNSRGVAGRVQLGCGLIKGLAFLHEHKVAHRDIKPDNLVCDDTFCLKIIDFDAAIEVEDENTEVDEYRGTKGWTAPEMRTRDGLTPMHSPIKADRWSCGRVLLVHIMVGKGDNRLSMFARRLIANDPQQRPSLLEWQKLFAAPFSHTANVLKDAGKEVTRPRQDTAEGDGESMKPPDAKKRRLDQTEPHELRATQPMGEVF